MQQRGLCGGIAHVDHARIERNAVEQVHSQSTPALPILESLGCSVQYSTVQYSTCILWRHLPTITIVSTHVTSARWIVIL